MGNDQKGDDSGSPTPEELRVARALLEARAQMLVDRAKKAGMSEAGFNALIEKIKRGE